MTILKTALAFSLLAVSLLAISATSADAQRSYAQTNQWSQYSSAPFSREANERFTP